ncbi:hypothetical protein F511_47323 [Dorcoceras hygrometricum]|uniref:Uncharacterized protein n=1 Tax=Dorcoceras hygrometricum TaxID=472368 RepID=A0A2Z6ZRB6_9LAMI|nr:hypothetical protein F511_47323 [Dorcoceras hygrometricum]
MIFPRGFAPLVRRLVIIQSQDAGYCAKYLNCGSGYIISAYSWGPLNTSSPSEQSKLHFGSPSAKTVGVYTEDVEDRPSSSVSQKSWLHWRVIWIRLRIVSCIGLTR